MPQFHVHVDAIVRRGEEILIMKRAMGALTGAWYVPGGSLEEHETPEEGVRREIREETELEVANVSLFRVWEYRQDAGTPAVGITFVCDAAPDAEPRVNEEHSAARWVTPRYYRERFLSDEIMAALASDAIALKLVSEVRAVLDAYLEAQAAGEF